MTEQLLESELPAEISALIEEIGAFIDDQIVPLEQANDNARFFDHRREYFRTDFEHGGKPSAEWEALLEEMVARADRAGLWRFALPEELGGRGGSNFAMAVVREHLNRRGIGLHNDPQSEISMIGNFPTVILAHEFGTPEQQEMFVAPALRREVGLAFGLTEPNHGSDATHLETTATRDGDEWVIDGVKRFNSGMHRATHDLVFARTSGSPGEPLGITAFIVPREAPGLNVEFYWWTFNMPTDHAEVSLRGVRVGDDAILGELDRGLLLAQRFVHENRIRQAASSLGAAAFCIEEAVKWARARTVWGKPLWHNQGIQFPLAELWTDCELVRGLVRRTAAELDRHHHMEVTHLVAMANYRANRLACEAADRAMQTCGGMGYTRHMPFEHIYRHHRRYRITEGTEEVQIRKVGYELFKD
ncbi:MAG TPA: acyl-CoA dehydrogenase family protein [Solirubrobacteraceae bacterium]|nr:acyl-CoA dehydrogenase family protein [Solirubrobacteraceae bacterium]